MSPPPPPSVSQHHAHGSLHAVVSDRNILPGALDAVDLNALDATAHTIRVLHDDPVRRPPRLECDLVARPPPRNAGIDVKCAVPQRDAEDGTDDDTVHPACAP